MTRCGLVTAWATDADDVLWAEASDTGSKLNSTINTYANLGGSLIVRRCIDKPKWGNYPINL